MMEHKMYKYFIDFGHHSGEWGVIWAGSIAEAKETIGTAATRDFVSITVEDIDLDVFGMCEIFTQ